MHVKLQIDDVKAMKRTANWDREVEEVGRRFEWRREVGIREIEQAT